MKRYKRKQENFCPLELHDLSKKWLVWNGKARRVAVMDSTEFCRFAQSHALTTYQAYTLLHGIDPTDFDLYAKWYVLCELLHMKKITLYDSYEAAKAALEGVTA